MKIIYDLVHEMLDVKACDRNWFGTDQNLYQCKHGECIMVETKFGITKNMQTLENEFVSVCVRNCTFPLSSLKFCLVGHGLHERSYLVAVDAGPKIRIRFKK